MPVYKQTLDTRGSFEASANAFKIALGKDFPETNIWEAELRTLISRSLWMVHNDGYASAAMQKVVARQVGTGIKGVWKNKRLKTAWEDFIKHPTLDGVGTFNSLQATVASELFHTGEVFTRTHGFSDFNKVGFSIEAIAGGYCPYTPVLLNTENPRAGIVYARATGAPVRYRFYNRKHHSELFSDLVINLVEVSATQIIHTYEKKQIGQKRGIPALASALKPLWEIQDLLSATTTRQLAAQGVGWIVEKPKDQAEFTMLGDVVTGESISTPMGSVLQPNQPKETTKAPILETIVPGGIHYIEEGEKINFADPSDIGGNLLVMIRTLLRKISSSVGILYEQLSGDISQVNYSSIRAGLIDVNTKIEAYQQLVIITSYLQPVADKFKAHIAARDRINLDKEEIKWILPKVPAVDELKAIKAELASMEGEHPTQLWSDVVERNGHDFDTFIKHLEKEQEYVRKINPTVTESPTGNGGTSGKPNEASSPVDTSGESDGGGKES